MNQQHPSHLAENLKSFRLKRGFTQQEFSKLSGLARSTVTNIESGEANPSLEKVICIAEALKVSVDQLISKPRPLVKLYKEDELVKENRGKKVQVFKLFPGPVKGIAIDKVKIGSGEIFRGEPHLSGAKEYLTVVKGSLEVTVNAESYLVNENQVFAFPGDVPHAYKNVGKRTATYMSVVIPDFESR